MKRKLITFAGCFIFSIALIGGMMFATDYFRCSHLMKPLFVVGIGHTLADDGGSGTYQGLGYSVDVEGHLNVEHGYVIESVEMRMFGKVIAASIS